MPWKETGVLDERIRFVTSAIEAGQSFSRLCEEFGISRQTGYRWLSRYETDGSFTSLVDRPRTPKTIHNRTSEEHEQRVIELRKQYGWGAKKLHILLKQEGVSLSIATINRIIKRNGLVRRADAHQPATKRFERDKPNELWQIDFKGRLLLTDGKCYPLSIIDDHSRFALGLHALAGIDTQSTYEAILSTFESYGLPAAMLMDHGSPWWSTNSNTGLTWISVQLHKQGIKIYHGRYRHPQTQGKVEAFHRTLDRAFDHHGVPKTRKAASSFFAQFVHEYNHVRPHEGIGMKVPATLYQKSALPYQPDPPAWQYASDYTPVQLNSQGSMAYEGKRYFVGKPLADETVAYHRVENKLIVMYRAMYVREIDLITGHTRAFFEAQHGDAYIRSTPPSDL